jgi:ABC-type transporter Mla subunit MlaD
MDIPDLEGITSRMEVLLDSVTLLMGGQPVGGSDHDIVDFADVAATLQETLDETGGTFREVNGVIAENRQGFNEVVERLAALEQTATLLMNQLNEVVAENRVPLNETMANLQQLTEEASARLEDLAVTLKASLQHFEDMGGNASDILDEQRPTIEGILVNLEATTRNLRRLSETLANQPSAIVRGAKARGRKDGEAP